MAEKQLIIAVVGASDCSAAEAALAEEVGRLIAARGAALVCGGLGGIMEAACRGAAQAGGLTIGILPGDDPAQANPHVALPLVTGIGYARNAIVAKSAAAVIAVGGRYGTLSEISYALQSGRPVIGLGTWEIKRKGKTDSAIVPAAGAAEAVALAFELTAEH